MKSLHQNLSLLHAHLQNLKPCDEFTSPVMSLGTCKEYISLSRFLLLSSDSIQISVMQCNVSQVSTVSCKIVTSAKYSNCTHCLHACLLHSAESAAAIYSHHIIICNRGNFCQVCMVYRKPEHKMSANGNETAQQLWNVACELHNLQPACL